MNNKTISEKTGLSAAEVTRILNRTKYSNRRVTWRQAVHLSQAFGQTISFWRKATQFQIKKTIDAYGGKTK